MPLHAGNKCCVLHSLPCVMQSESMQLNSLLEATFGCSHQAVSRGAGTHCPLSTKNTNLISVSPPHLWLTDGAQTTIATTTQLHPRPSLSSSNTISRWQAGSAGPGCCHSRCEGAHAGSDGPGCNRSQCEAGAAGPVGPSCCRSRCAGALTALHEHRLGRVASLPLGHLPNTSCEKQGQHDGGTITGVAARLGAVAGLRCGRDGGGTVAGRWRDSGGTVAGQWRDSAAGHLHLL